MDEGHILATSMKVTVECYGAMRDYLPDPSGRETVVETAGGTVADVVEALGAPRRLIHLVLVDESQATLETEVSDGSRVTLMPAFAGGSG